MAGLSEVSRQLHIEGYLQKDRVELEEYVGAPSISLMIEKQQDAENKYTNYPKKGEMGIRVHENSLKKLKAKLKEVTGRSNAMSMEFRSTKLKQVIVGGVNYFNLADMKNTLKALDEWLRRRIRLCYWKQWKKVKTKYDNLKKLGIDEYKAWEFANTRKGYWRKSNSPILARTLSNKYLRKQGFITLTEEIFMTR